MSYKEMKNIDEKELSDWIGKTLFPEDFSEPMYFASSLILYSALIPRPLIATLIHACNEIPKFAVSPAQFSQLLLDSCQELHLIPGATWFQVNYPDNAWREVVAVGLYSYREPLSALYFPLERNPAEEGGATIVGLLGKNRDWMLTIELERHLIIKIHGSTAFCEKVKDKIGRTPANTKH